MKPTERNKRIAAACRALGDEGCAGQLKLLAELNPDSHIFWDEDLREAEIVFGRTVITVSAVENAGVEPRRDSDVGSDPLLDALDEFGKRGGRMVFWTCPNGCHIVDWNHEGGKSVATCRKCGTSNAGLEPRGNRVGSEPLLADSQEET